MVQFNTSLKRMNTTKIVLNNNSPLEVTICRWAARVKRGGIRLEDEDEHSGSSKRVTVPDIVETDRDLLPDEKWK